MRSKIIEQAYRPSSQPKWYGSCSMLAKVNHIRKNQWLRRAWGPNNKNEGKFCAITNAVMAAKITSLQPIQRHLSCFYASDGIKGNHLETSGWRLHKYLMSIDLTSSAMLIGFLPIYSKLNCYRLETWDLPQSIQSQCSWPMYIRMEAARIEVRYAIKHDKTF